MRLPMRCLAVLVSFSVAVISTSAFAGTPLARPESRDARDHLDRGNKLYNLGSFDEAIEEYKAGALIDPVPVFDYNLGQSNRQLGKYREALWHYDRFLHKGQPTGELRDAVIAFMAEMRTHLENKAQTMPPTGPAPSAETSSSTASPGPASAHTRIDTSTQANDHHDAPPDWVGWSLTGSGVIAFGVSGDLLYRASQLNHQGDSRMEMSARQNLYNQASARNLAGVIVGIGGAALTGLGIAKLTLHHRSPSQVSVVIIGINNRGVLATGRL